MANKFKINHDGSEISFLKGGGFLMLFGLPFFLVGLFVIASTIIPGLGNMKSDMPPFGRIVFGLIFSSVGGGIMFGRSGIKINKTTGIITKWWGVLFPFRSSVYQLADMTHLYQTQEVRKSDNRSQTVYPLYLIGGVEPIHVMEVHAQASSRSFAEEMSKFLNLDIEDDSSGISSLRKAGTLDQSIKKQAYNSGETVDVPEEPHDLKSTISPSDFGGDLEINIPPIGLHPIIILAVGPGLLFASIVGYNFLPMFSKGDSSEVFRWIAVGFIVSFFIILPVFMPLIAMSIRLFSRTNLRVNRKEVRVTTGWVFKRTVIILAEEIEEMIISESSEDENSAMQNVPSVFKSLSGIIMKGPAITLKTDHKIVEFGRSLSLEEIAYLGARIKKILIS